ncbi:hypothetical protein F511_28843 [Dorcoceras hygrometricum]|uniref:Uncharacterized protein n=1 Tax=Dorcoceras hygrometricum TaxID=472368 RepID=A0A2Z7CFM0_9LAMI|nr:hypothetical protein F511_28843 [Dorcoceras hygrometricum]
MLKNLKTALRKERLINLLFYGFLGRYNNLRIDQLKSEELSTSFKSEFDRHIKSFELSVEDLCESNVMMVNNQWRQDLDLLRMGDKVKDDLSSELTSTRLILLD